MRAHAEVLEKQHPVVAHLHVVGQERVAVPAGDSLGELRAALQPRVLDLEPRGQHVHDNNVLQRLRRVDQYLDDVQLALPQTLQVRTLARSRPHRPPHPEPRVLFLHHAGQQRSFGTPGVVEPALALDPHVRSLAAQALPA